MSSLGQDTEIRQANLSDSCSSAVRLPKALEEMRTNLSIYKLCSTQTCHVYVALCSCPLPWHTCTPTLPCTCTQPANLHGCCSHHPNEAPDGGWLKHCQVSCNNSPGPKLLGIKDYSGFYLFYSWSFFPNTAWP